jgi:multicomponent Na+:H+ antiporter subunit A
VAALVLGAGVAAAIARSRLRAVLALGAAGYGVALIFVLFGAPDLAMTQVLVETLTVILVVAVFRHLPVTAPRTSSWSRARHALLASSVGLTMTVLTWSVLAAHGDRPLTEFFLDVSRPLAEGRNVVNTILVDFRALDTLGEIAVLAIAAIGVIALLRLRPRAEGPGS